MNKKRLQRTFSPQVRQLFADLRALAAVEVNVATSFEIKTTSDANADALVSTLAAPSMAAKIKKKTDVTMAAQNWAGADAGAFSSKPTMAAPTVAPPAKGPAGGVPPSKTSSSVRGVSGVVLVMLGVVLSAA